jgi:hypothetical protein
MDVVVTVPYDFDLDAWIDEGDPAGTAWSGATWHFYLGSERPRIAPGERVYIIYNGAIRGYAPLISVEKVGWRYALVRHGGAVAVSLPRFTQGFRGFQYRWWEREEEQPFPDWMNPSAALFTRERKKPARKLREPKVIVEKVHAQRSLWDDL